jgi:hypothetical protein
VQPSPRRLILLATATTAVASAPAPAVAQTPGPRIARGTFDARLSTPGTRTVYHRRWKLSPSCLGSACARIRLQMLRSDGRYDAVTLRRDTGVYRGRVRTRALCRGPLATRSGTISVALHVTETVRRNMVTGRETIITGVGADLTVASAAGVCPPRRHIGHVIQVSAGRIDLPAALDVNFHVLTAVPSVTAHTNAVQFSDISQPAEALVARRWDFGDPASGTANRATERDVTHTYARAGNYTAKITVVDRFGQIGSASGAVTVLP